jgi:NADH-quinone oxidoreductase subunit L
LALLRKRFYFDELYSFLIAATQGLPWGIGSLLRFLQVGNLQAYSFLFGLGIVALIYFTIFR